MDIMCPPPWPDKHDTQRTSEDPDAAVQSLVVDNFRRLETNLDSDQCAFFFDLFSLNPSATKMYNQLLDTEEDCHVYVRLKLKGFNST